MHYLFALWDGGGAVPPQLEVVRGLVNRGHTVTALADPTLATDVRAAGAEFRPWQRAPHRRDESELVADDRGIRNPAALVRLLLDELIAGPADAFAADVIGEHRRRPCDAVVAEMPLLGALVAGRSLGRPTAALMTLCYAAPHPGLPPFGSGWPPAGGWPGRVRNRLGAAVAHRLWDRGLDRLNDARAGVGLPRLDGHLWDQLGEADRVLVLTSPDFDLRCDSLPTNVRYVGPQLGDPAWATEPAAVPDGDEPLVLVSLSSTPMDQLDPLRRIVRALHELPVRAVVTTGPAVDPEDLAGDVSRPGIAVTRSAPHGPLLREAAAVVTHGGHGTVIKSLAAGVPVLCLPLGRDQPDNAARVVAAGAGLRLRPTARPSAIAAALRSVLEDPGFTTAARRLAERIGSQDRTAAVAELEAIAVGHPAS